MNNYYVQVTDKYYSSGCAVELQENLTKEAAIALYKQCERAYPREAYRVIWGSNDQGRNQQSDQTIDGRCC